MPRHIIRPLADRHLDEQAVYIAEHSSLDMGRRFYKGAEETFKLLASKPELGKRTNYQNHFLKDSRVFPMRN